MRTEIHIFLKKNENQPRKSKNIHISILSQTELVVFMCLETHTHTYATTIEGKRGYEFKREQRRSGYGEAFGERKRKRIYEVATISKHKRNILEIKGYYFII